jgi:hypothetical protein
MEEVRDMKGKMIISFGQVLSCYACMSIPFFNLFIVLPAPKNLHGPRSCMLQTYASMKPRLLTYFPTLCESVALPR